MATAEYAPTVHFYPALSGDPSPRVYSRKARVTIHVKPLHEVLDLIPFFSKNGLATQASCFSFSYYLITI